MKFLRLTLLLALVGGFGLMSSCNKGGDPKPSIEKKNLELMSTTWVVTSATLDGPEGNKVAVFYNQSGELSLVDAPIPNEVETAVIDQGVKKTLINKDTGEVIEEFNVNDLTPARVARLNKAPAGRSGGRSGTSSGTGKLNEPKLMDIDGKPTLVQWDRKNQRYVPFKQPGVSKSNKSGPLDFLSILPKPTGQRTF